MDLVVSFTKDGKVIGDKIQDFLSFTHLAKSDYHGDLKTFIGENWKDLNSLVFVSSTGIAIRYVKDFLVGKDTDPAIIVVDDQGRYAISLLSGHLGGANDLAGELGQKLGLEPIITTATDSKGLEAVDVFAKKHKYQIENIKDIKGISMAMLEDKRIGFFSSQDEIIAYPNLEILSDLKDTSSLCGLILVTNELVGDFPIPSIVLRPKDLIVGIGSRRGKTKDQVLDAIFKETKRLNKSHKSIRFIGSCQAKADEEGIIEAADYLDIPFKIYTDDQIKSVQDNFSKSDFVKKTIGLYNVSESCAYLESTRLLSQKQIYDGITISIGEI